MTDQQKRKILVTSALPYSNGDVHLGHLVEYLQTDFWVRFQKMRGHECLYFCADDTHGTPIMIAAKKQGIQPEKLIEEKRKQHLQDFQGFEIDFTHYSSTNSVINRELVEEFFNKMEAAGHICKKEISQYFCENQCQMFLPDRFIKGNCPNCDAPDQYGDSCEQCSMSYSSIEIKNPLCVNCHHPPVMKKSDHLFFELAHFQDFLSHWIEEHTSLEVCKKLKEWFKEDLRSWDISRDAPYFGFKIPNQGDKYFYVWVDAPIGYISATEEWCRKMNAAHKGKQKHYTDYWKGQKYEIYHFIGKDIIYFHSLFWPAMLKCADLSTPNKIFSHGFLTIDKEKMSKSKGTSVLAKTYLDHLHPLSLRYYLATKLNAKLGDVNFNSEDFLNKNNAELVGKIVNLASRSFQMIHRRLGGRMGEMSLEGRALGQKMVAKKESIARHYEEREFSFVMVQIRELAEEANQYLEIHSPWKKIKNDPSVALAVLTDALNFFRTITIYLTPILPSFSTQVVQLFNESRSVYTWEDLELFLENQELNPYKYLIERVERESIEKILDQSRT